jgi:hypothetical protein
LEQQFLRLDFRIPGIKTKENDMDNGKGRTQLVLGLLLILAGGWYLADSTLPAFHELFSQYLRWPYTLAAIGAALLILGLVLGAPGMTVPAAIVAGVGGIFIYQETNHDYASWSYMWTLIPGFAGIGSILAGLLGDNTAHNVKEGLKAIVFSAVLFLVFSVFLGDLNLLGDYGPAILLILLGLWVLASGFFQTFRKPQKEEINGPQ